MVQAKGWCIRPRAAFRSCPAIFLSMYSDASWKVKRVSIGRHWWGYAILTPTPTMRWSIRSWEEHRAPAVRFVDRLFLAGSFSFPPARKEREAEKKFPSLAMTMGCQMRRDLETMASTCPLHFSFPSFGPPWVSFLCSTGKFHFAEWVLDALSFLLWACISCGLLIICSREFYFLVYSSVAPPQLRTTLHLFLVISRTLALLSSWTRFTLRC